MSPAMVHASTSFIIALGDAALRSLILGCFVTALLGAFRVKNVRTKLIAWRSVLLAALAMPILIAVFPAIPLAVPVPGLHTRDAVVALPRAQAEDAQMVVPQPSTLIAPRANDRAPLAQAGISLPTAQPPAFDSARRIPWLALAFCVYLAVSLAFCIRVGIGMWLGRRLRRAAAPVQDSRAARILAEIAGSAGLHAIPHLAESETLSVPVTLGVHKHAILLPANWREWDEDEFAAVLAHEVSHVERRDALVQHLALVHRAIFWFSPLGWWLERHLADLSEQASDEAALAGGADRTRYAEALLGFFAELEAAPGRVWWHGVSMAKAGQAEKRVERILAWRNVVSDKLTKAFLTALAILAIPVIAMTASLHPSLAAEQGMPAPPPAMQPPAPPSLDGQGVDAAPAAAPLPLQSVQAGMPGPPPLPAVPQAPPSPEAAPAPMSSQAPMPPMNGNPEYWRDFANQFAYSFPGYFGWGQRFVIESRDSDVPIVVGSREDEEHARALRDKIPGDFIWFERDEKSYVITDPATVNRAKKMWTPQDDAAKQQEELRKKQEELGTQMREQVEQKMQDLRVKMPDLSAQLEKLQSEVKDLTASGATLQQLGDLQREVGELQRALGEARWQSQEGDIERQAGELGRQMGELGRQQGEIARQQVERARQSADEMKQLLDDAIAKGLAKPE